MRAAKVEGKRRRRNDDDDRRAEDERLEETERLVGFVKQSHLQRLTCTPSNEAECVWSRGAECMEARGRRK